MYSIFFGLCRSWQGKEWSVVPGLVGWKPAQGTESGGAEQPNLTWEAGQENWHGIWGSAGRTQGRLSICGHTASHDLLYFPIRWAERRGERRGDEGGKERRGEKRRGGREERREARRKDERREGAEWRREERRGGDERMRGGEEERETIHEQINPHVCLMSDVFIWNQPN